MLATVAGPALAQVEDPLPRQPQNVLFIGNSHTQRHGGMDWAIGNIVHAEDPERPFEGTVRAANGVTLEYHYRNGARDAIRAGHYDTVVLQGYLPGIDSHTITPFLEYARRLGDEVRRSGARTVFFMTWPQGRGDWSELDDFVRAHRQIADELGVDVAPVGLAFAMAQAERPELQLLSDDDIHATWEGAYLAEVMVYATLFDRSPMGLHYTFGVDPEDAAFMQRIAAEAIDAWDHGLPSSLLDDAIPKYDIAIADDGDVDG